MGTDASSMLLGITENESPACSNKYLRLGELDASINNGSSLEFFMAVNYQKKWRLTSIKPNPDKPEPKKMPRSHKDTKDFILLFIETFEKCSILLKAKEGENFNHRNTLNILRIKI